MENKKIRIVDIARLAEVSTGTVDRVLHNRGRIAPDKKQRIENIIKQIGYQPNIAARLLATGQTFSIAVVAPSYVGESYWKQVSDGMTKATEELEQYNIKIEFLRFDQYDRTSFDKAVSDVEWEKFDGVIIATLFEERVKLLSSQLDSISKPYIYIDSQVEGQNDIAYFGVDAYASGYIASKLLCLELEDDAPIVITHIRFRRDEISTQMRRREQGLLHYLNKTGLATRVEYIEHNPQATEQTIAHIKQLSTQHKGKIGIVVLNSRVYELVDFINSTTDISLRRRFVIAGFEAIQPNIEAMSRGDVNLLISQRPELQGYNAVRALSNLFLHKIHPNRINYTPIDILIPENIKYYTN